MEYLVQIDEVIVIIEEPVFRRVVVRANDEVHLLQVLAKEHSNWISYCLFNEFLHRPNVMSMDGVRFVHNNGQKANQDIDNLFEQEVKRRLQ